MPVPCAALVKVLAAAGVSETDLAATNPRYLAYALAQGSASRQDQMEKDAERWPGGRMVGFLLWIDKLWTAWRRERGVPAGDPLFPCDHEDFDVRLAGLLKARP